jgi:hypothetical protein
LAGFFSAGLPPVELDCEVADAVAAGRGMRWITVGHADQPARRFPGFPFVFEFDKTHWVDVTHDFQE